MSNKYFKNLSQESQFRKELRNAQKTTEVSNTKPQSYKVTKKLKLDVKKLDRTLENVKGNSESLGNDENQNRLHIVMVGQSVLDAIPKKNPVSARIKPKKCVAPAMPIIWKNDKDQQKPAIISSSNTTKGMAMEERKPFTKNAVDIPKLRKKNKTKTTRHEPIRPCESSPKAYLDVQLLEKQPSFLDPGVEFSDRLKSFERLDEEFYNLVDEMNKDNEKRKHSLVARHMSSNFSGEVSTEHVLSTVTSDLNSTISKDEDSALHTLHLINIQDSDLEVQASMEELEVFEESKKMLTIPNKANELTMRCLGLDLTVQNSISDQQKNSEKTMHKKIEKSQYIPIHQSTLLDKQEVEEFMKVIESENIKNEDVLNVNSSRLQIQAKSYIQPVNSYYYQSRKVLFERPPLVTIDDDEFIMSQEMATSRVTPTVHHLCTTQPNQQLRGEEQLKSLFMHTPDKFKKTQRYTEKFSAINEDDFQSAADIDSLCEVNDEQQRLAEIAEKIMAELEEEDSNDKQFMKLQEIMNQMFEKEESLENNAIVGVKMNLLSDNSRCYNTPAPPKFYIHPTEMTTILAPEYVSIEDTVVDPLSHMNMDNSFKKVNEKDVFFAEPKAVKELRNRIIHRKYHSLIDLQKVSLDEYDTTDDETTVLNENESDSSSEDEKDIELEEDPFRRFETVLQMRRRQKEIRPISAREAADHDNLTNLQRRCHSQPDLLIRQQAEVEFLPSDYKYIMNETEELATKLQNIKIESEQRKKEVKSLTDKEEIVDATNCKQEENIEAKVSQWTEEVLSGNIRKLERSLSLSSTSESEIVKTVNSQASQLSKHASESNLHVATLSLERKIHREKSDLVSVLKEDYWYKWMDEIYAEEDVQDEDDDVSCPGNDEQSSYTSLTDIHIVPMEDAEKVETLYGEIDRISFKINSIKTNTGLLGFHLCRRGACYKKIGEIKKGMDDLNRAIELEPKLLDAYWHRHLMFLIQQNIQGALDDLHVITTQNPTHTNAFRSRAEIFRKCNEIGPAVVNYSQAIRSSSKDSELYYARAALFEQRGDDLLALEDYKVANQLKPDDITAIEKIGMYHFQHRSWVASVKDFTELLSKQPKNASGYFYRALANTKLFHYEKAISDFSVCIHLQPDNYKAFYHRGCLIRKILPKQALQDLSVSLLLECSLVNVNAYLHRGVLYMNIEKYEQASTDFEAAVRLNRSLSAAHINLGVINMIHRKDIPGAIKRFNVALKNDPTYIRAILCRAEAYEKIEQIGNAVKDYTRVIHMQPDNTDFIVARGRLLLKMKEHELASLHIKQCAAMSSSKTSSTTQHAAVETFLKHFDKAIGMLDTAVKSQPIPYLYTLSGKTKMKAKMYVEAVGSFSQALNVIKPWNPKMSWPREASEIFYLVGMCHVELKQNKKALEAFNNALKVQPEYAEASYQRGLVKMKLGTSKGVHDFNRALANQPTFYQAYLARANYYGMNKRYAKAIMNCNEAVKLQNRSVRAFLNRGAIKYNIQSYKLAIKDLSQAIDVDPSCSLAYFNRAVCYHARKFYFKALKDYSIVLMSDETLKMKALRNRGLLYFHIGDINNARQDFQATLEGDCSNASIHHALGLCYYRLGEREQAIRSFTTSLENDSYFYEALLARGNVLMDYGPLSSQLARRDYVRALHLNPLCVQARVNLAHSIKQEGYYMKAWNLLTRTIEINPNQKGALEARSLVNLQMGNTFGAFLDVNNAIRIEKTATLLTSRGVINQCLGHQVNAMNDYQEATKLDASCSLAYYNAASLYFQHRQYKQAISYYGYTIDWNSNDAAAYLNRGAVKFLVNDKTALDDLDVAASLSPNWAHIYFNRGNVYFAREMYEKAEEDFTKALQLQARDALAYKRRADTRGKLGKKEEALKDYHLSIMIQSQSR